MDRIAVHVAPDRFAMQEHEYSGFARAFVDVVHPQPADVDVVRVERGVIDGRKARVGGPMDARHCLLTDAGSASNGDLPIILGAGVRDG